MSRTVNPRAYRPSTRANRTREAVAGEEVERMLAEAAAVDAEQDGLRRRAGTQADRLDTGPRRARGAGAAGAGRRRAGRRRGWRARCRRAARPGPARARRRRAPGER